MNGSRMRSGKKSKISGNKWKWTHNNPKPMGHSKGSSERKFHRDKSLYKKNRNISNEQPYPIPTGTGGTTTKTAQSK